MKRIVRLELPKILTRVIYMRTASDQNKTVQAGFCSNLSYCQKDDMVLAEFELQKAQAQAAVHRRPYL